VRVRIQIIFALLLFAPLPSARAKPLDAGVLLHGTETTAHDDVAPSYGIGIEAALLPLTADDVQDCPAGCIVTPHTGPYYFGVGAFARIADRSPNRTRRDVYGLHGAVGFGWSPTLWAIPFVTVGLDALIVSTALPGEDRHVGPTLGVDGRAGVIGYLGSRIVYTIDASYLAAVAPGTGDNAGGLVLEASIGWRIRLEH
jgi:hypothetical protein